MLVIADGTSYVGEGVSLSWLWWVVAVLVGLVVIAFVVGSLVKRASPKHLDAKRGVEVPEARTVKRD